MGTHDVELECAGKSTVDGLDPFVHIINHICPKSSERVTHDSHKLQTSDKPLCASLTIDSSI